MAHGTLAMTVEVSNDPSPPPAQLPAVVRRAVGGAMAFMLSVEELDRGELRVEHQTAAQIARQAAGARAENRGFSGGEPLHPSR
jgi:hypothetical protein